MTVFSNQSIDEAAFDAESLKAVTDMGEALSRTMVLARTLIQNRRHVDLAGLDRGIGLLCAKALDLRSDLAGLARPQLVALLGEADSLAEALEQQVQGSPAQ